MKTAWMAVLVLGAAWSALGGEQFYVVETTDNDGTEAVSVMDSGAFRELESTVRTESAKHSRALRAVQKQWDDAEGGDRFPSGAVSPRKVRRIGGSYASREEADKAMNKLQERNAASEERRRQHEEERQKRLRRKRSNAAQHIKDAEARKAEREAEREALYDRAVQDYKAALAALMQPAAAK